MHDTVVGVDEPRTALPSCPACGRRELLERTQIVDLGATLARWNEVSEVRIPEPIIERYAQYTMPRLHECAYCGLGVFLPIVTGDETFYRYIAVAEYYRTERWDFRECLRAIARVGAQSVLDVGCGQGAFLDLVSFQAPNARTVGQDLSAAVAGHITRHGHESVGSDMSSVAPASFECVTALQVLEHAPNPEELVREIARVVVPGGVLLLSVPDVQALVGRFPDALTEVPPHHVTRWTELALRALMERCGVRVRSVIRQPLEKYLWDAYLPAALDAELWLSGFLAGCRGADTTTQQFASVVRRQLEARGVECIWGIASHTMLLEATVLPGGTRAKGE